jgi:hypothetical protein
MTLYKRPIIWFSPPEKLREVETRFPAYTITRRAPAKFIGGQEYVMLTLEIADA